MSTHRTLERRTADVRDALSSNPEGWLATADPTGTPHLIAVSTWWTGEDLVVATTAASRTARNLEATRRGRVALGTPDDAVLIDVDVVDACAVTAAAPALRQGFVGGAGWDPADEPGEWRFFRLSPTRIQAYRGYGEQADRDVMRDGGWRA